MHHETDSLVPTQDKPVQVRIQANNEIHAQKQQTFPTQKIIIKHQRGFFRPISMAIALCLIGYIGFSMANIYWSSEQRRQDHGRAVHPDDSTIVVNVTASTHLPKADEVVFFLKKEDNKIYRIIAEKTVHDRFINETLTYLQDSRDRVQDRVRTDLKAVFDKAFADKDRAVENYADWFFAWGRSWQLLWEGIKGAAAEGAKLGLSRTAITEAARHEVEAYMIRHYKEFVLQPELRERSIISGVEQTFHDAHREYCFTVSSLDAKLQIFLSEHTRHIEEIEPEKALSIKLDWEAQKWKAPRYSLEDKAMEGVTSIALIAGSTVILGPALESLILPLLGEVIGEIITTTEFAVGGAVAGSEVPVIGNLIGLAAGVSADYALSLFREKMDREDFVKANRKAAEATMAEWQGKIVPHLEQAVNIWFDDTLKVVSMAGHK